MTVPRFLDALGFTASAGFIEFRERVGGHMRQHFVPVRDRAAAAELVGRLGSRTDLYMGVAPRREKRGGRDAIEHVHVLWADCDSREAMDAIETFAPSPSLIVNSGNGRHCYWPLETPAHPDIAEQANRRLARALKADERATDAARILRPPGTRNFKSDPPKPVEIVHLAVELFQVGDVVAHLADAPLRPRPVPAPRAVSPDDVLMSIPADVYVPALTGRDLDAGGKARCPFHGNGDERTPSLHAYSDPARGWYCFGCEEGGTIVDFGARLYAVEPRGDGFREIRRRLEDDLIANLRRAA